MCSVSAPPGNLETANVAKTDRWVWYQKKKAPPNWTALHPIPRTAPGNEPKQRPAAQKVADLPEPQEDTVYQLSQMARVSAEMARWVIFMDPRGPCRVAF